jgi:hypothetical protein
VNQSKFKNNNDSDSDNKDDESTPPPTPEQSSTPNNSPKLNFIDSINNSNDNSRFIWPENEVEIDNFTSQTNQNGEQLMKINENGNVNAVKEGEEIKIDIQKEQTSKPLTPASPIASSSSSSSSSCCCETSNIDSNSNGAKSVISFNEGANIFKENEMHFNGTKSLNLIDTKLDTSMIQSCNHLLFNSIDFDVLKPHLTKLRSKFPNAFNVTLTNCDIKSLNKIDHLNELKRIDCLTIKDCDICEISFWRPYIINRLVNSLQLKQINDQIISIDDFKDVNNLFNPIVNLSLEMPHYKLISMMGQEK